MPRIVIWKEVFDATVLAGASFDTGATTFGEEGTLRAIYILAKTGDVLYRVPVTIKIKGKVITKDEVPASLFPPDEVYAPKLEIPIVKADEWQISGTNNTGVNQDIVIVFKIETVEEW